MREIILSLSEFISNLNAWLNDSQNPWFDRHFLGLVGVIAVLGVGAYYLWEVRVANTEAPAEEFVEEPVMIRYSPARGFRPQGYRGPRRPGDHTYQHRTSRTRVMQSR
jgi:hypothetical protein